MAQSQEREQNETENIDSLCDPSEIPLKMDAIQQCQNAFASH